MPDKDKILGPPALGDGPLQLNPLAPAAAADITALFRDEEVQRYSYRSPPQEVHLVEAWIRDQKDNIQAVRWTMHLADGGDFIGLLTLKEMDHERLTGEVGYSLLPHAWGQGHASRALGLLIPYAFGQIGLQELEGQVMPGNHASIRVLEKQGFRQAAILPQNYKGQTFKMMQYLLSAEAYQRRHA